MSNRNIVALTFIIASLVCLYPGLIHAMMTIKVNANLPLLGNVEFYEATQSILQSIKTLFAGDNYFVAWLILLFSVVVPIIKALALLTVILFERFIYRLHLLKLVSAIGKWSMADVFVVSIFMSFLTTHSNSYIEAYLHEGFYFFSAYCALSIIGTQLIEFPTDKNNSMLGH